MNHKYTARIPIKVKLKNSSLETEAILKILKKIIRNTQNDYSTDKAEFFTNDAINKISPLLGNKLELCLVSMPKNLFPINLRNLSQPCLYCIIPCSKGIRRRIYKRSESFSADEGLMLYKHSLQKILRRYLMLKLIR